MPRRDYRIEKNLIAQVSQQDYVMEKIDCTGAAARIYNWKY